MYKIIDTHCDTASELLDRNENLKDNTCMINKSHMDEYESCVLNFAAYVSKESENPMDRAIKILQKAKNEIRKNDIELILCCDDLERTLKEKRHGAILSIEDARALCGNIMPLYFFYNYGVRMITLAWNDDNEVTDGANSKKQTGLTEFGRAIVREMNRLNMMIDISHISECGFWDVMEVTKSPIIASHSSCYHECPHIRNLKDNQIKSLIDNDGMMCINIYPPFLEIEPEKADIKSIIRHIEYALSMGAEDNLGMGSDFDGIDTTTKEITNLKDYQKLFKELEKINYSQELIDKITHKNFVKFMKRTEK